MPQAKNLYLRAAIIAVPMLAASVAWITYSIWKLHGDAFAEARTNASQLSAVISEQASRSIKAVTIVLDELMNRTPIREVVNYDEFRQRISSREEFNNVTHLLAYLPNAEVISISDNSGGFLLNTRAWPAEKINIAGNDPFDHFSKNADSSLFVSASRPSLSSGQLMIYFSRRLENARGEFLGVLAIGVRPEYLLTVSDNLALSSGVIISLLRLDGSLVAQAPARPRSVEPIGPDSESRIQAQQDGGTYQNPGRGSPNLGLTAVRPISNAAFVISVGVDETKILAAWQVRAKEFALQMGTIAIAITALTITLLLQAWQATAATLKLAEKSGELENANALFEAVMSNMREGVAKFDCNDRLLFCNRNYAEIYGLTETEFLPGTHISKIWNMRMKKGVSIKGDPGGFADSLAVRLRSSGSRSRTSIDHLVDGRYIQINYQPLPNGNFITTHDDITQRESATIAEHQQLEELVQSRTAQINLKTLELQSALMKQRAINEQQQSFVSMASHEFRTPLAIIDGAAQKLQRRAMQMQPDDIRERAETIRSAVQRMTGLMESVLSMAKFDFSDVKLSIVDADLYQVVFDCCFRHMEVASNHRIHFDLDALPRAATFDPILIDQVFTNLIANAIKFSPQATQIKILASRCGEILRIDVQDFGIGIDADDLSKISMRYFRAKTSMGIAGTGIGLNVVKTIVEMHGGTVEIQSVKGAGSVFSVYLPVSGSLTGCCVDEKSGTLPNLTAA